MRLSDDEPARSHADGASEGACEVGLISKPARCRNPRDRLADAQHRPSPRDPQVDLKRVRRQPGLIAKASHELKARKAGDRRQRLQPDGLVPALAQMRSGAPHRSVLEATTSGAGPWTQVGAKRLENGGNGFVELEPRCSVQVGWECGTYA